jgi:hypothetical protein
MLKILENCGFEIDLSSSFSKVETSKFLAQFLAINLNYLKDSFCFFRPKKSLQIWVDFQVFSVSKMN